MNVSRMIYLDNAATSWPKPAGVGEEMARFLAESAGNPGRGGHVLARAASQAVEEARALIGRLINAENEKRVVLTHGCTDAVHLAITGRIEWHRRNEKSKPHIVVSTIEHNAVLRCLFSAQVADLIDVTVVGCDKRCRVSADEMLAACTDRTTMVCLTHASNSAGTIQPVREVGHRLASDFPNAVFLVDAAQTAGHIPIDVQVDRIDMLSLAGHKGLGGPTGTGGLYISRKAYPDDCDCRRLICPRLGGTGVRGFGVAMPTELPDAFEGGTLNAVGFAGLVAAMKAHKAGSIEHELDLAEALMKGLLAIPGVTIYGEPGREGRTGVVMFNIDGQSSRAISDRLDSEFGICVRGGMHCAPLLHKAIGTGGNGAVRASPGAMTTLADIRALVDAVRVLAGRAMDVEVRAEAATQNA